MAPENVACWVMQVPLEPQKDFMLHFKIGGVTL